MLKHWLSISHLKEKKIQTFSLIMIRTWTIWCFIIFGLILSQEDHMPFFGDVVVFDTTYNTNKYLMIFAPFVGVNHHGQTIIFGCRLLSDEMTESFVWLFSKFLEAMLNHVTPTVIIIDQDAIISKAISMVLPFTLHRFCLWRILNKFSEKNQCHVV